MTHFLRWARTAGHVLAGLVSLAWWWPSIALALGVLLSDRVRFALVMRLGRLLVRAGWPAVASAIYDHEMARTERRARALAGRRW